MGSFWPELFNILDIVIWVDIAYFLITGESFVLIYVLDVRMGEVFVLLQLFEDSREPLRGLWMASFRFMLEHSKITDYSC